MPMNEKSENRKLYFCDNDECCVITFIPHREKSLDICPACGMIGLIVRGPVSLRTGLRPGPPSGRTADATADPSPLDPSPVSASDGHSSVVDGSA
jgi:hypothetical protein